MLYGNHDVSECFAPFHGLLLSLHDRHSARHKVVDEEHERNPIVTQQVKIFDKTVNELQRKHYTDEKKTRNKITLLALS